MRNGGKNHRFNLRGFDTGLLDSFITGLNCHVHQRPVFTGAHPGYDSGALPNPFIR
jgi:hypothetical protein